MAKSHFPHRGFLARSAAVLLIMAVAATALILGSFGQSDPPPTGDFDSDNSKDKIETDPNPAGNAPGEVEMRSGSNGTLIVRIRGEQSNDRFGYSVAVLQDVSGDSAEDIIVGAPNESGGGRAYVFAGPFNQGQWQITTSSATRGLASPHSEDVHFGERVGAIADIDGDGATDIRVRASYLDQGGNTYRRTYIYSGATGELLFEVYGFSSFNPWADVDGDADDDGDVDGRDEQIVIANLGLNGAPGTLSRSEGDLSADGVVSSVDLAIATSNQGLFQFAQLADSGPQCPSNLPTGSRCSLCRGRIYILTSNVVQKCPGTCEPQQVTVYTSNGTGGGDWFDPNTWVPHGVPGTTRHFDVVRILGNDVVTQTDPYPYTLGFYYLAENATHSFEDEGDICALVVVPLGSWQRDGEAEPFIRLRNAAKAARPRNAEIVRFFDCSTYCVLLERPCAPFNILSSCSVQPCTEEPSP
jgi:hypothetical protein